MEDQKILKEDFDDFHIENNEPIGQGEEDFETLFNKVFKKKEVINENNEDYHEMECQLYYLKGISNYIKKEETSQIIQKMNFNHCQKDIISKKEISINEEDGKDIITINQQKSNSKNDKNLEIDIKENISNEIEITEKKKKQIIL